MKKIKKLKHLLCLFLITLVITANATTVSAAETSIIKDIFISEDNYKNTMNDTVIPYLNSIEKDGFITGKENAKLYYKKYLVENSKGSIVISHGFTEYIERYYELIYYFAKSSYNVFIMEHRGHGRSSNLSTKDNSQINVEDFNYYVSDLKTFIDDIVVPANKDNDLFLYGHSMGGAISAKFLINHTGYFNAAVLNAPMMSVKTGFPEFFADAFATSATFLGFGDSYAPGQTPYTKNQKFADAATSSQNRFTFDHNLQKDNTKIQKGGLSLRWLNESIDATQYITSKKNASKVKTPILLFQAGNDTYVNSSGQDNFVKYAGNCTLVKIKDGKHELYRETDDILLPILNKALKFYSDNNK